MEDPIIAVIGSVAAALIVNYVTTSWTNGRSAAQLETKLEATNNLLRQLRDSSQELNKKVDELKDDGATRRLEIAVLTQRVAVLEQRVAELSAMRE